MPNISVTHTLIDWEAAAIAVKAAVAEAASIGVKINVAVVDSSGVLAASSSVRKPVCVPSG